MSDLIVPGQQRKMPVPHQLIPMTFAMVTGPQGPMMVTVAAQCYCGCNMRLSFNPEPITGPAPEEPKPEKKP